MIRIMTAEEPDAITITVDGQLVDGCVEAVEAYSHQAMDRQRPVHLFLRDVHISMNTADRSYLASLGRAFD